MLRTCAHVVATSPPSPRGLTSTPRAQLVFFPSSAYSVHSPSSRTHFIRSYLYLCLSPLTRMQAPWGRGVLSVWVPSACPAPGMGAGTRHSQHEVLDKWRRRAGTSGKESLRLQPAPSLSAAVSTAWNSSSHSANGMEASFRLELAPGKAERKKEKKQTPKIQTLKPGLSPDIPAIWANKGWSHFELAFLSFPAESIPTDHLRFEIWKKRF